MTRIDSTRLSEIFRTLASKSKSVPLKAQTSGKAVNRDELRASTRDEDVLKARLQNRLRMLEKKSEDFPTEAPYITIQEIMSWEFGDQFLNHSDFKHITNSIVSTIRDSPELSAHMDNLIQNLTKD